MIKDVLNDQGDWKSVNDYIHRQRPVFYELTALKNAIGDYISEFKNKCERAYVDCIRDNKPVISNFNVYGWIVHKKAKGCSHFYKLLCAYDKNNGWAAPCNGMERDLV